MMRVMDGAGKLVKKNKKIVVHPYQLPQRKKKSE